MHINEFLRTRLVEWANWSQLANGQVGKDVKLTSNERKFLINFLGPATTMVCFQLDSLEKLSLNFSSWLDEQENEHAYAGCTKYQPTKAVSNDIYQEKISTLGAKGCPPFRFLMLWDARLYLCMEKSSGNVLEMSWRIFLEAHFAWPTPSWCLQVTNKKNCWAFAFIEVINDSQNLAFEGFLSSHVWWLLRAKRIDFNDLKGIPELYFKNSALQTLLLRQLLANHPTNQCHSNWNLVTFQILRGILVSMPPFQVKSSLGCSNGPHLRAAAICHQSEILRSDLCHLRTNHAVRGDFQTHRFPGTCRWYFLDGICQTKWIRRRFIPKQNCPWIKLAATRKEIKRSLLKAWTCSQELTVCLKKLDSADVQ